MSMRTVIATKRNHNGPSTWTPEPEGIAMFRLPLTAHPEPSREPFSRQTLAKASRLRGATVTESVCPYCAVGCGQLIYTKAGKVIVIDGNPASPIHQGRLLPNRAVALQLAGNPPRITHVLLPVPVS